MGDPLSAVAAEDHSILALGANNGIRRNEEGAGAYIKYCSRERCSGGTWRRLAITSARVFITGEHISAVVRNDLVVAVIRGPLVAAQAPNCIRTGMGQPPCGELWTGGKACIRSASPHTSERGGMLGGATSGEPADLVIIRFGDGSPGSTAVCPAVQPAMQPAMGSVHCLAAAFASASSEIRRSPLISCII